MDIFFVSSNIYKINEVESILKSKNINIIPYQLKIKELQSLDMKEIIEKKIVEAFKIIGRPVIVEHTGLYMEDFDNFPGGLTQIFWDSLKENKFCKYFSNMKVSAITIVAFCDGKKIEFFEGEIEGIIVNTPRGCPDFQWDCVFQPNGYTETFAEMGKIKNTISMRKSALDKLKRFLEVNYDFE